MRMHAVWKTRAVLLAMILAFSLSSKKVEKLGDTYQIVLPVLALGCSAVNGQAVDFFVRYWVQWGIVHGSKAALGDAKINQRPNGNYSGMPSGHTATAVPGASNLVHECLTGSPWVKGVVILTAGFVGGSRIESEAHTIWQVLAGALVGWLTERAFRKMSPLAWMRQARQWLAARFGRGQA